MLQELSIKTEGDVLVVLGKQEHKEGGQTYVSKQFEQRYQRADREDEIQTFFCRLFSLGHLSPLPHPPCPRPSWHGRCTVKKG
jgi:hypothetical protein